MVAKSTVWVFAGGYRRLIFMYLLLAGLSVFQEYRSTVQAQAPDAGKLYLDRKELEVKWIAGNASLNNGICGSLNSCSAACSRVVCNPISDGILLLCTSVNDSGINNICPSEACPNKILVDYSRSFVRLPAPVSTTLQSEVAEDICFQRMLDNSTFKNISVQSSYSNVYFGSTSGAFRAFPGREQNQTQCTSYDPRKRPWYLNGISVSRDLKILVDTANSMGNPVIVDYKRPPQTTYLDVAKALTQELLMALSPGDYVEVITFDNITATSLGGAFPVNTSYDYFNPSGHPELAALVSYVNTSRASPVTAVLSDLNGAISKAANSFNQLQSLKVIIVISNGLFVVNSSTFPSAVLLKNQAKLMVYKLPTNDDGGDTFLLKTSLQKDICSVKGSFESLDALATANPLYSMRSFFTYLAGIQLNAVDNAVTWSNKFESVSQYQDVITPTYPDEMKREATSLVRSLVEKRVELTNYSTFGSDRLLIGVAGIDVTIDNLNEPLRTLVYEDFQGRSRGTLQAPASISMTCNYQNTTANSSCPTLPDSSAICPKSDNSSTFADLTCCDKCGLKAQESGLKAGVIAGISIAGVAAALILAIVLVFCWKNRRSNRAERVQENNYRFPGDDHQVQG